MFIINQTGNHVIEAKEIDMRLEYDKETKAEVERIHNEIMSKCYNYGSTENAQKSADRCIKNYLQDKKPICRIFVNDKWYFGDYDEAQGKSVFEQIVSALKNGEKIFDMRKTDEKSKSSLHKEIIYRFATLSDADLKILKCKYPDMDFDQNAPDKLLERLKGNNNEHEFLEELKRLEQMFVGEI